MKHYRCCLFIALTLLISIAVASKSREKAADSTKRKTHAVIVGEVRGNGSLWIVNGSLHLLVQLRLARDDQRQAIARTKVKLSTPNATDSFAVPFRLKYPLSKMNPHNTYTLAAQIRDESNQLIYVGDLPVPVTERKEQQASHLTIRVRETPSWYKNIEKLSPLAYKVTQLAGTEESYTSDLYTNKKAGIYTCVVCNSTLFSSKHKYLSGTGWPSFYQVAIADNVATDTDRKYGLTRTEVHCATCKAHLGHVFDDGPAPTYLRYCMNGVALQFYADDKEKN